MALFVIIFGVATILIFISSIRKSAGGKSGGRVRNDDPSSALWMTGIANDSGIITPDSPMHHTPMDGHHHSPGHHDSGGFDSSGGGGCDTGGGHHH